MQESCNLESKIQLKETGIPPTIGVRNPTSNDKESEIQYLESGILESKTVLEFLFKRGAWNALQLLAERYFGGCYQFIVSQTGLYLKNEPLDLHANYGTPPQSFWYVAVFWNDFTFSGKPLMVLTRWGVF